MPTYPVGQHPHFGKLISEATAKKGITNAYLAKKLDITEYDVLKIKNCKSIDEFIPGAREHEERAEPLLRKLSGILGIGYRSLHRAAGYARKRQFVPNFYTEEGDPIDEQEILAKLYYQDPKTFRSKLESLLEK